MLGYFPVMNAATFLTLNFKELFQKFNEEFSEKLLNFVSLKTEFVKNILFLFSRNGAQR